MEIFLMYLYDHHTSLIIIAIQVTALIFAFRGYKRWKDQAYSKSKHIYLIELFEVVTQLKNALIEFDSASSSSATAYKILHNGAKNTINNQYDFYKELHDSFDSLVLEPMVTTQTKVELVEKLFSLSNLNAATVKLLNKAKDYRNGIMSIVSGTTLPAGKPEIEKLYLEIEQLIKEHSDILN